MRSADRPRSGVNHSERGGGVALEGFGQLRAEGVQGRPQRTPHMPGGSGQSGRPLGLATVISHPGQQIWATI